MKFLRGGLRAKIGTGKNFLLHCLRSSAKSTFKCLCKQTLLWRIIMSKMPREPWRSRLPWEWDIEQSASTHVRHTHCTSRQLGTTANQRYGIPQDQLWEACQMARVYWGTQARRIYLQKRSALLNWTKCNEPTGMRTRANSVVPMEITFMDNGGNIFVLNEFIEQINSYIWIRTCEFIEFMWNPYRFLISSLGLPTFFLRIAKRER